MSPGGGELYLSVCPGVGNRTSSTQMPGGVPGGEMVTGRIEPRISFKPCKNIPVLVGTTHRKPEYLEIRRSNAQYHLFRKFREKHPNCEQLLLFASHVIVSVCSGGVVL